MKTKYFDRNSVRGPLIQDPPHPGLGLVVVIPALDEPELLKSLESLGDCTAPPEPVEIIVVINHSEGAPAHITQSNLQLYNQSVAWSQGHSTDRLRVHVLYQPDLPARKAGVGLARKIGMDEAVRRCMALGKPAIPVVCFDADCLCSENYLEDLQGFFARNPVLEGCAIYFEHPYATLSPEHRRAIIAYELHLRYFIQAQRWADFPFA